MMIDPVNGRLLLSPADKALRMRTQRESVAGQSSRVSRAVHRAIDAVHEDLQEEDIPLHMEAVLNALMDELGHTIALADTGAARADLAQQAALAIPNIVAQHEAVRAKREGLDL